MVNIPQLITLILLYIWATFLEIVAHFLIKNSQDLNDDLPREQLNTDQVNAPIPNSYPAIFKYGLRLTCAGTFFVGLHTYLPIYPAYSMFVSALWITVYTDLNYMLISRLVSLYFVPVGIAASLLGCTQISANESLLAALLGGAFLLATNKIFKAIKGHDGLGQGDIELLACIGSWIGIAGVWCTLVIGSTVGTIIGVIYLILTRTKTLIVPFGPFLVIGALTVVTYPQIISLWIG